jgi:putative flippase GtrA
VRREIRELLRYAIVGLSSNALLFALYLLLTRAMVGHKLAATIVYVIGTGQAFVMNKTWTFEHRGDVGVSLMRFLLVYGLGYLINIAGLVLFVDWSGYSGEYVQGILIFVIAAFIFMLQKWWVFHVRPDNGNCR